MSVTIFRGSLSFTETPTLARMQVISLSINSTMQQTDRATLIQSVPTFRAKLLKSRAKTTWQGSSNEISTGVLSRSLKRSTRVSLGEEAAVTRIPSKSRSFLVSTGATLIRI